MWNKRINGSYSWSKFLEFVGSSSNLTDASLILCGCAIIIRVLEFAFDDCTCTIPEFITTRLRSARSILTKSLTKKRVHNNHHQSWTHSSSTKICTKPIRNSPDASSPIDLTIYPSREYRSKNSAHILENIINLKRQRRHASHEWSAVNH